MWRTFNCGIGFVLIVAPEQLAAVSARPEAACDWRMAAIGEVRATRRRRTRHRLIACHDAPRRCRVASGRGSNLQALHQAQQRGELPITHRRRVFRQGRPAGALAIARDARHSGDRPVGQRDFASPRGIRSSSMFDAVEPFSPTSIVCAGYMRIISEAAHRRAAPGPHDQHPSVAAAEVSGPAHPRPRAGRRRYANTAPACTASRRRSMPAR